MTGHASERPDGDLVSRVAATSGWYHTMELAPGVTTPGFFDLRPVVGQLPWPDVRGRRCLDVATMDGFYAFEMEQRGAAEVVAIDIADQADIDWLPRHIPAGYERGRERTGERFRIAREALDSRVERRISNVYDLAPAELGTFDVVVVGALLEHLRDPFRALEAIRGVCTGTVLSVEQVDVSTSLLLPRVPVQRLVGHTRTWTHVNRTGHLHMLRMAGFDVVTSTLIGCPFGPCGRDLVVDGGLLGRVRPWGRRLALRLLTGGERWPFSAVAAEPAPELHPAPR